MRLGKLIFTGFAIYGAVKVAKKIVRKLVVETVEDVKAEPVKPREPEHDYIDDVLVPNVKRTMTETFNYILWADPKGPKTYWSERRQSERVTYDSLFKKRRCPDCGSEVGAEDKWCKNCGINLKRGGLDRD